MRCPKCSYISFDNLTSCSKCSSDLSGIAAELHGTAANLSTFPFLNSILQASQEPDTAELDGLDTLLHIPEEEELHVGESAEEPELLVLDDDELEVKGEVTEGEITLAIDDIEEMDKADGIDAIGISAFEEEMKTAQTATTPLEIEEEAASAAGNEEDRGIAIDLEGIDLSDLEPASVKAAVTASEIAADLPESQVEIEGLESLQLEPEGAATAPTAVQKPAAAGNEEIEGLELDFGEGLKLTGKDETKKADETQPEPEEEHLAFDLSAMIQEGAKAADREEEDSEEIMDLDLFHDDAEAEATTDGLADFDLPETEGEGDLEIDLSLDDIHQDLDLLDTEAPEPAESLKPAPKNTELKLEMEKKDTE